MAVIAPPTVSGLSNKRARAKSTAPETAAIHAMGRQRREGSRPVGNSRKRKGAKASASGPPSPSSREIVRGRVAFRYPPPTRRRRRTLPAAAGLGPKRSPATRELLTYLSVLAGAVLFAGGVLVFQGEYADSWGRAFRDAAFTVPSIMTSTGFVTADFDEWDTAAKFALVALMFVGGCGFRRARRGARRGPR
jgi:Cation transport protein